MAKKLFRRIFCCWLFDSHFDCTHFDDRGAAGEWKCNDCGHHEPAIVWLKPPPRPREKIYETI